MAIRTGGCYPPLVGSGHGPCNGQADAIAFSLAAVGGIPSVKPLKKMGELIPGNIAGGVGDGEMMKTAAVVELQRFVTVAE